MCRLTPSSNEIIEDGVVFRGHEGVVNSYTTLSDTSAAGPTALAYPEGDTKPYAHNTINNIIKSPR
ncbi:hypothetical protein J40TS1_00890 [Paenibacillus montaniterrae]|uniref:Uncharacterized protein n=1 Tax=Paenibacillus montaniterrae TaxID=429341 RepID=A0A919YHH1_9BACL|nr:hypothetical protein J40TS1_00890 [Paenibacillus montaniterrae]